MNFVSLHSGIPFSIDKERTTASCHRMDKSQKCMLNMKVSLKRLSAQCDSVRYNSNSSDVIEIKIVIILIG